MSEQEILEGNKLIAEFIGARAWKSYWNKEDKSDWFDTQPFEDAGIHGVNTGSGSTKYLYFHSSWDWLMPVVRKIVEYCIDENEYAFLSDEYTSILETIPLAIIEDSWKVVVEFIKWYNKNNQNG